MAAACSLAELFIIPIFLRDWEHRGHVIDKGLLCLMCYPQLAYIWDVEKEGTGGQRRRKA